MNRRRLLAAAGAAALGGCAPMLVQRPLDPQAGLREPRLGGDHFVSFDGARLGLTSWMPQSEPWAVIAGLHGMNDYANAYHLAAAQFGGVHFADGFEDRFAAILAMRDRLHQELWGEEEVQAMEKSAGADDANAGDSTRDMW